MTLSEYDAYITAIDDMEKRLIDAAKYPVVKDNKIKQRCKYSLEISKMIITYLKFNITIYASEKSLVCYVLKLCVGKKAKVIVVSRN